MLYRYALLAAAAIGASARPAPAPQGVTAAIPPSAPAPAGCSSNFAGTFGIVVIGGTGSGPASQLSDGQPQAPTGAPVAQIPDGQPQAPTGRPVTQIGDGQVQAPTMTFAPVRQISDGQPQVATAAPVAQIPDGQVQAPTAVAVTQIGDGQIQAPTAVPVSQLSDGQPQATPAAGASMVACQSSDTLTLTLNNGILLDDKGRTGYIAANYQFQFDAPAQTGAIYTSGFSVCADGTLALGGSNVFYQCLSGDFYNLYDTPTGAQCSPATISVVELVSC